MTAIVNDSVVTAETLSAETPSAETLSVGTVLRLRPIVHASPVPGGVHFRGWSSSFTLNGGNGLWRVWQLLAPRLVDGVTRDELVSAGAPEAVRLAAGRIVDELSWHDMLVTVPADWTAHSSSAPTPEVLRWLESVADRPDEAWRRLADAHVIIEGDGPVAWAADRALRRTGLSVVQDPARGTESVVLTAAGWSVRAAADDMTGYVLPPAPVRDSASGPNRSDAVAGRLSVVNRHAAPSALHSLVGSAAAHRLICAVGNLPDPGQDRGARPADTEPASGVWRPATVLVARMDPLRAEYHAWLGQSALTAPQAQHWLDDALARYDALCDDELGVFAEHQQAELVQTPAALGACRYGTQVFAGVAPTADLARVQAGVNAVQRLARRTLDDDVFVGANSQDAIGRALRAEWAEVDGNVLADASWSTHPAARRWYKALTLRLGISATVTCELLATGVHRCTVRAADDSVLGLAVEARAGDAAAFALLAAVGTEQWNQACDLPGVSVLAPCGAAPALVRDAAEPVAWADEAWTWPVAVGAGEDEFAQRLTQHPDGPRLIEVVDAGELSVSHSIVRVTS